MVLKVYERICLQQRLSYSTYRLLPHPPLVKMSESNHKAPTYIIFDAWLIFRFWAYYHVTREISKCSARIVPRLCQICANDQIIQSKKMQDMLVLKIEK